MKSPFKAEEDFSESSSESEEEEGKSRQKTGLYILKTIDKFSDLKNF